jgi:hypothetical protein
MEVKRSRAVELVHKTKNLLSVTSAPIENFDVTIEDATSIIQATKALAVLYKLHLFLHQSDKSSEADDLIASIDEEITRISKKYTELLLAAAATTTDEIGREQDAIETKKRLHELLGDDSLETIEAKDVSDQDDDMMQQLLHKKKKKNKNKKHKK